MSIFNPRILDASIRDVTTELTTEQKAEILIHAMKLLKLASPRSQNLVENGVQSCLQVPTLATPQTLQALLLRGRARMAAGDITHGRNDLHKVLEIEPEHQIATSLLSIPQAAVIRKSRLWDIETASNRLSPEIWIQIASYLPRRDLKTLLRVPHVLSRIAFELVFQTLDLHLGRCERDVVNNASWSMSEDDLTHRDLKLEMWLAQRTAEMVARVLIDPAFSRLVRKLRVSASPTHRCDHMVFRTTMLSIALAKLVNLRVVSFSGSNEVASKFAEVLASTHPNLQCLYLEPMVASHVAHLPQLTNLTDFSYVYNFADHSVSVSTFLAQNRTTLRKLNLRTPQWSFPSTVVTLGNLTHLHFYGTFPANSTAFADILNQGVHLECLRIECILNCNPSIQFKGRLDALPHLKQFGFSIAEELGRNVEDPTLFPTIAEFLRNHTKLVKLELSAPTDEHVQRRVGYDAAVLAVLPLLTNLRWLTVTITKDTAPGLASWLIPRQVTTLHLSGLPSRDPVSFLQALRPGMALNLRVLGLDDVYIREFGQVVETCFPNSVRLVRLGHKHYTVRRKQNGGLRDLDEWPERRAQFHMEEWLESLECDDAWIE